MTMNAGYTVSPTPVELRDRLKDRARQPHGNVPHTYSYNHNQKSPVTPIESHLLSPYSSHVQSNSASPTGNFNTPADTVSSIDPYQQSDFSSDFGDPFLGVDFNDVENGLPGFLENFNIGEPAGEQSHVLNYGVSDTQYPLSPDPTPAIPSTSMFNGGLDTNVPHQPSDETRRFANSINTSQFAPQLTPDTNGDGFSSDGSLAPNALAMAAQSPRVTVSMWNRDEEAPVQGIERSFASGADGSQTNQASISLAGDLAGDPAHENLVAVSRDAHGGWLPHSTAGYGGLAPGDRPTQEVPSINQQAASRERDEKNKEVFEWAARSTGWSADFTGTSDGSSNKLAERRDSEDNIPPGEISLGDATENKHIPGQAYLHVDGSGGALTQTDFDIMRQLRTWGDAPTIHAIQSGSRYQPLTSQAAIEKFNRQCQDNESIVSRAATWGTRRRSLPSIVDIEGIVSGNFLKKLSISGHSRRPSFMKRIPSLVRKPSASQILKRKGSNASEVPPEDVEDQDRRSSKDTLAPPSRTSSWGISGITKKPTPSLNTALVGIATGAAAIGTTHARSGSISATPITSPKSPFGSLSVPPMKNALRRSRSKTEVSKGPNVEAISHPNLVEMLKKQGGPPVASLSRTQPVVEQDDDDDDDDDEGYDDVDMKPEPQRLESIEPTPQGFREHILRLNPGLPRENGWLVDRIAHQMIMRYKQLQSAKVKHLSLVNQGKCPCGTLCVALGGSAISLDGKGGERGVDPLSARPDSSDGDTTPLEGGINSESFPLGIPMPPTTSLPAEFECQLCFTSKKFLKPSDWTKHVHEDVQPFTCTWERCRDPKMFKRKADWVRHENEGHRHLEWWTCDVEDCRHVCYRRDNFLQHLVREHKFAEPKIKTKAAIKKAGGVDYTWHKVEQCHVETSAKPSDEPCRFCRKTFPTWKKLTVHLAKHMEHISLPVLKLVDSKELHADTIISPVQDLPRPNFPVPVVKQESPMFNSQGPNTVPNPIPIGFIPQGNLDYGMGAIQVQNSFYGQHQMTQPYTDISPNPGSGNVMMAQNFTKPQYHALPVTTGPSYNTAANAYIPLPIQDGTEPFPQFDPLGIQDAAGPLYYDNLTTPSMQPMEQYGSHPPSSYNHSPHQGHGNYFNQ
ncbi:hypothetical protein GGS23DRAFT_22079 [Durotheca rogersii]|uniref:uncharacterized protein n=1 Tax=Durotheca rogersii TaxID=419775 RepID=UPI00221FEA69|nr:uncharacterized protein GGS23DRAFT_22079 [Durotheca rogersii]KAI5868322.1 hypothetical protein GGS23DRAFT_22079 [Durotheca rogersii]